MFVYYLIPIHLQFEISNTCVGGILKLMSAFRNVEGVSSQVSSSAENCLNRKEY